MKLRPITLMGALLVAGLAVAGLVAWHHRSATVAAGRPASLPIRYQGVGGAAAAAAEPSMAGAGVMYVAAPGLSAPASLVRAWHEQPVAVRSSQVATLAAALDLTAPVEASNGGWTVSTPGRVLHVRRGADGVWSWQLGPDDMAEPVPVPEPCLQPMPPTSSVASTCRSVAADGGASTASPLAPPSSIVPVPLSSTTTTVPATAPPSTTTPATAPPTTTVAPTSSTTIGEVAGSPVAQARAILIRAGFDVAGWTASTVDWGSPADGSSVNLAPTLDGMAVSDGGLTLQFGPGSYVQSGHGSWGTWVPAGVYPLIGTAAAVADLNHGVGEPVPDLAPVPSTEVSKGSSNPGTTAPVGCEVPAHPDPSCATSICSKVQGVAAIACPVSSTTTSIPEANGPAQLTPPAPQPTLDCIATATPAPSCGTGACPMLDGSAASCPAPVPTLPATGTSVAVPPTTRPAADVRLDHVEVELAARTGVDGSTWLVPTYRFTSSTAPGAWTVVAVDRQWFQTPPALPGADAGDSSSTPVSTVIPASTVTRRGRPGGVLVPTVAPTFSGQKG